MTKEEKAENLRAWLKSSGLSQMALSREINCSYRTVQDWVGERKEMPNFVYFLLKFWFENKEKDKNNFKNKEEKTMATIMAKAKSWYSKKILEVWYTIVNASEVPKVGEKYQKYKNSPAKVIEKVEEVNDIQTPELKENFWFYQIQMPCSHDFLAVRKPQKRKKSTEFPCVCIGESDSAYLIADTSSGLYRLEFHEDETYYAKECYGDVEIDERYKKVFSSNNYLRIYDDTGLMYKKHMFLGFEKVDLYMCENSFVCIIHWHD